MILQYLYKNWSQAGTLLAVYITLILVCMAPLISPFLFLVWLQFPLYLIHECEEHAIGHFKQFVNTNIFKVFDKDAPLTDKRVFWINILAVWFLLPASAVACQFISPGWGFIAVAFSLWNATTHIIAGLALRKYNPGLFVSLFLNYPVGLYALYVAHKNGYSFTAFWYALLLSIAIHAAIFASALDWYRAFKKGK